MSPLLLPTWEDLASTHPLVATMRAYLTQIGCVLRPRSVANADLALRSLAAFLVAEHPDVQCVAGIGRPQIEGYKPWLAARPGQNRDRVTPATITHRLGTLRMFFLRIDEWGWDDAPARVPMFHGDVPRQDHGLPKALDDPTAAKLLRAAQADPRMLVGVTVEFLLRTGLRVGEYTALAADAVVLIGDPLAARADRQAPRRPLPTPTSPCRRARRRLPRRSCACRTPAAAAPRERQGPRPAHRHPVHQQSGHDGRTRAYLPPTSCATRWPRRRSTAA